MITIEIIEDCKKGRHKAQRKVFDFFVNHMFSVCMRYLNDVDDAEDAVSQGFTKVFKAINALEYRDVNTLRAWIKKIMINESLMQLRKRVNFSLISVEDEINAGYDDHRFSKMDIDFIMTALNSLPPGYRTVLNLYAIEGYSHAEIAAMLNINEGTSRSQLSKARSMMKERLNIEIDHYGKRTV